VIKNTFTRQDAVLPAYFPAVLLRLLLEQGHSETQLLQGTGLQLAMFEDDNFRFSFVQHQAFIRRAIDVSDDPHLGIRFGQSLNVTALGMVGFAAMSSQDLAASLATTNRYFKIRAPLLEPSIILPKQLGDKSQVALQIEEALDFGDTRYFMLISTLCGTERLMAFYTGLKHVAQRASLACPRPPGWQHVAQQLSFEVSFEQPYNRMYFPASLLRQPLTMADPQAAQSAGLICEQMLARLDNDAGLDNRVRQYLLSQHDGESAKPFGKATTSFPNTEQAAAHFCVSARTFRRELSKSGTSYQQILDKIRQTIAIEYLSTSRKPIVEIALELGYEDLSNFGRAFKRWTGKPPSAYRP